MTDRRTAARIVPPEWVAETASIGERFARVGGDRLPERLREQRAALLIRLAEAGR